MLDLFFNSLGGSPQPSLTQLLGVQERLHEIVGYYRTRVQTREPEPG